jgi:hypothetical protein
MYIGLHVKYTLFLSDFTQLGFCGWVCRSILKYQISLIFVLWELSCSMRTDVTELTVTLQQFLRTGLKIRHPFSFNWPVSEDGDFSTNWTTADETQRLFLHQRITLCRKHLTLHFLPYRNYLQYSLLPCSDSAVSFVKIRVLAGNIRTASPTV